MWGNPSFLWQTKIDFVKYILSLLAQWSLFLCMMINSKNKRMLPTYKHDVENVLQNYNFLL